MNNVQLIGRLTKDVELRYFQGTQGQQAIARFTVAVDRMPKQDGTHETDFITCSCFGRRGEVIAEHFQKGSNIGLVGRIRTGSYQNQQGSTIYTTEVEVLDIDFIDPKAAVQPNPTTPQYNMQQGQQYYQAQPVPQQAAAPAQPAQQPSGAAVPPRQTQRRSGSGARSNTRSSQQPQAVPVAQAQPQNAMPMQQDPIAAQGGFMNIPEGIPDEGLPFN